MKIMIFMLPMLSLLQVIPEHQMNPKVISYHIFILTLFFTC